MSFTRIAKDDLCEKCLLVARDAAITLSEYQRDMLELERIIREWHGAADIVMKARHFLNIRQKRILKGIENGNTRTS